MYLFWDNSCKMSIDAINASVDLLYAAVCSYYRTSFGIHIRRMFTEESDIRK